ncbi:MAG: phospho-sugar mutase, partial [Simkaniaceae bacterium]|nr:phospho-sugar mutase [Simkaniaceae bacterium]
MSEINVQKRIEAWLSGAYDSNTKDAIRKLSPEKLHDAFYKTLTFGTGGMRGLMGPGTNRLNLYTIRGATQGLANYILKNAAKPHRVAISYDCRHLSREFAEETAGVLEANGIEALLAPDLRPTPYLSFMVRHKKCSAGIMITASHNPPAYNGYKVYWSDGAQVVAPHDQGIINEVNAITDFASIAVTKKFTKMTDADDLAYLDAITPEKKSKGKISIVYTNLHGTGATLMQKALL